MANLTPCPQLSYREDHLFLENVSLDQLANNYGTPLFVYSYEAIKVALEEFKEAFKSRDTLVCYAVKANGNLSLLKELALLGAGFDIVSSGELKRVILAGGDPKKTVFSGVGKSYDEINFALKTGILCFNIESQNELRRINECAIQQNTVANISFRVNPNVDPKTHPYIATGLKTSKFGVPFDEALNLYREAASLKGINIVGIDCHIGSQITDLGPFIEALERILELVNTLNESDIKIHHIDIGGGLGVRYKDEEPIPIHQYAQSLLSLLTNFKGRLILEPGRRIIGNSGLLLTQVEYLKQSKDHSFAIVNAAMNDLIRPSLYEAWHEIVPVTRRTDSNANRFDIVGPVCETGDILGYDRKLSLQEGDYLAILSAGAYGASMSSNYNARGKAAEILVCGSKHQLIKHRETIEDMTQNEKLLLENNHPITKI